MCSGGETSVLAVGSGRYLQLYALEEGGRPYCRVVSVSDWDITGLAGNDRTLVTGDKAGVVRLWDVRDLAGVDDTVREY